MSEFFQNQHTAIDPDAEGRTAKRRLTRERDGYYQAAEESIWQPLLRYLFLGGLLFGALYLFLLNIHVLIVWVDDYSPTRPVDAVMVLQWKPGARQLGLLAIPNQTKILLPDQTTGSVRSLLAYGEAVGNSRSAQKLVKTSISALLNRRFDFSVFIKYSQWLTLVDALGGVRVLVPQPMDFSRLPYGQNAMIEPGYQVLDGRAAVDYLRYTYEYDEALERLVRQQVFLQSLITRPVAWRNLPQAIRKIRACWQECETDLTSMAGIFLLSELHAVSAERWDLALLPGRMASERGFALWIPDALRIKNMMRVLGRPLQHPAAFVFTTEESRVQAPPTLSEAHPGGDEVLDTGPQEELRQGELPALDTAELSPGQTERVEILNGCGVPGVASRLARKLAQADIVIAPSDITNARHFNYTRSFIKVGPQNLSTAQKIAQALGLGPDRIRNLAGYPDTRITIVLGKDYQRLLESR